MGYRRVIPALNRHEAYTVAAWGGSLAVSQITELIIGTGVAFAAAAGWQSLTGNFRGPFLALCLPWIVTPLAVLAAVSLARPVFEFRYVLFSVPALALLAGAAVSALGPVAGSAALVLSTLVAIPAQLGDRGSQGHYDDIRRLDQIIASREHPADAVLYSWDGWRLAAAAYPYGLARLGDIAQNQNPVHVGNLIGTDLPSTRVAGRITAVARVWLVQMNISQQDPLLAEHNFRLVQTWRVGDVWLQLYERGAHPGR
jgi:mannosyltransferase